MCVLTTTNYYFMQKIIYVLWILMDSLIQVMADQESNPKTFGWNHVLDFGLYKGKCLNAVPESYIEWIVRNKVYLGKPHISTWDTNKGKEVRNVLSCFDWYKDIWNSVAPTGYKWEDNPYVFVYEFERILV